MSEKTVLDFSKRWLNFKIRVDWSLEVVRYTLPNFSALAVRLSQKGDEWLRRFRQNGILRLEEAEFREAADYVDQTYFAALERPEGSFDIQLSDPDLFVLDANKSRYREGGTEIGVNISFKDPHLAGVFFHPDLNGVLYNYYRRQPYYRNQPYLQKISYDGKKPPQSNSSWHVDYAHQVSVMLLVSDVTLKDTHMRYALGSHRRIRWVANYPEDIVEKGGYKIFDAVGPRGTLFLFDAGGLHRASYQAGTSRKMLHLNITSGHHIVEGRHDRLDTWEVLAGYPSHSRRMMDKVGARPV